MHLYTSKLKLKRHESLIVLQREWAKQFGGDKQSLEEYKLFESFFVAVRSQSLVKHIPQYFGTVIPLQKPAWRTKQL